MAKRRNSKQDGAAANATEPERRPGKPAPTAWRRPELPWDGGWIPDLARRPVAARLRAVLWGLLIVAVPAALVWAWEDGFPYNEKSEVAVKTVLTAAALLLVAIRYLQPPQKLASGRAGTALGVAAALAIAGYYNFGAGHGVVYVHYWEQFHYSINAKYFPELGYDGLYAASLQAQMETYPQERVQPSIRDLRTNEMVDSYSPEAAAHRAEVKQAFSPERWSSFVRDHRHFLDANTRVYLGAIRRDHGYNPPPSWTFIARLFASWMPLDADGLGSLAMLDVALLAALFAMIFHTYGSRVGALAMVIFGLGYAGRYYWVGGAFLREDWLTALGFGICLLEKKRYRWAGACFAYAALVRLFPVLFLFGLGAVGLRDLMRREGRWVRDLAIGFGLTVVVGLGLGCLVGRGPAAWSEFAESISVHRKTWLTNNVGLENVVLYEGQDFRRELVDFSLPEPWVHWQERMNGLKEERAPIVWAVRLVFLALLFAACWRARPSEAAALGVACVFALLLVTCYYWQMLLFLVFLRQTPVLLGLFGLNLGLQVLHFQTPSFEMRYGMMSWGLLVFFLALLGHRAWGTIREWRHRPAAAADTST